MTKKEMVSGRRKVTRDEYDEIQTQYDKTPPPDAEYFMATGEHWILKAILDGMGLYTSGPTAAFDLAGEILSEGCDDDSYSQGVSYAYH